MEPSCSLPRVYQFRVVVQGVSPLIWRRLLICSDLSLATLHTTLQIVFARSDMHLHSFRIHGQEYGSARLGGPSFDADPRQIPLAALRLHRGERLTSSYNFIDHWVCDLRLEAMLPVGLDGGYVRAQCKEGWFKVIAGKSLLAFTRGEESEEPVSSSPWCGHVGQVENGPAGVLAAYASRNGDTRLDRRL